MFTADIYLERRKKLKQNVASGLILLPANQESPMNYRANTYQFRQDSTFLYYTGIDLPDLVLLIDVDNDREILFGNDPDISDIIWMGQLPTMAEIAVGAAIPDTLPRAELPGRLAEALRSRRRIHFLPPYRAERGQLLENLLGIQPVFAREHSSVPLITAVVAQRSFKEKREIVEIEKALELTAAGYEKLLSGLRPGLRESDAVAAFSEVFTAADCRFAFPPIVTKHGETLHNHAHHNVLADGDMLLVDVGAEIGSHYAADITRTFPVSGRFSKRQQDVYQVVLAAQEKAISSMKPGISFREVHLLAAGVIAAGLKDLGLMRGDSAEAVSQGAHALFFPHGLGHQLGLDVHDMEDLGEEFVGYGEQLKRSSQFGLAYLRFAKPLVEGLVLTVEPGIYFIPELIASWQKEKKLEEFINYDRVAEYIDFGGIRLEEDVLVEIDRARILGRPIPKQLSEISK